jgi:hypothetical protein
MPVLQGPHNLTRYRESNPFPKFRTLEKLKTAQRLS